MEYRMELDALNAIVRHLERQNVLLEQIAQNTSHTASQEASEQEKERDDHEHERERTPARKRGKRGIRHNAE